MGWEEFVTNFLQAGVVILNETGMFLYNGTPAAGNLSIAETPTPIGAHLDEFGNAYISGGVFCIDTSGLSAIMIGAGDSFTTWYKTVVPNPGASWSPNGCHITSNGDGLSSVFGVNGAQYEDANLGGVTALHVQGNGIPQFVNNNDNVSYNVGQAPSLAQAKAVPSTSPTTFTTFAVAAGTRYRVHALMGYQGNQNAGAPVVGWHGGSLGPGLDAGYGYTYFDAAPQAVYNNVGAGDRTGPTLTTGAHTYETYFNFTAVSSGTFGFSGACGTVGDTWNMLWCDLEVRLLS